MASNIVANSQRERIMVGVTKEELELPRGPRVVHDWAVEKIRLIADEQGPSAIR